MLRVFTSFYTLANLRNGTWTEILFRLLNITINILLLEYFVHFCLLRVCIVCISAPSNFPLLLKYVKHAKVNIVNYSKALKLKWNNRFKWISSNYFILRIYISIFYESIIYFQNNYKKLHLQRVILFESQISFSPIQSSAVNEPFTR